MSSPTPNVFVVGAGPVATALAGALRLAGVPVLGLWGRTPARARAAGAIAGVAAYSSAPPDLLLEADAVIVAVADDAIAEVSRTLLATGLINRHHVLLHCAGALSATEAFGELEGEVGGVAMMHPMRAIVDARTAMRSFGGTVFGIEGSERGRQDAVALVTALRGHPLSLSGNNVAAYHAAAAIASNYAIVLLDAAAQLFAEVGVEHKQALEALVPLTQGALGNLVDRTPEEALTGPIRRGDRRTVELHLESLKSAPDLLALYRSLGRRAVALSRKAPEPASPQLLDEIDGLLTDGAANPHAGTPGIGLGAVELRARKAR